MTQLRAIWIQSVANSRIDNVATSSYCHGMRAIGIKVLKNKLSEYVRLAASGETVLVTDRDRVVAELVPPRSDRSPLLADELWAEAVRQGHITPPLNPKGPIPGRAPIMSFKQLMDELAEDRADR